MFKRKSILIGSLLACFLLPTFTTRAGDAVQLEREKRVAYVSGGIGELERAELSQIQNNYSLKLVFATDTGAYLADIKVVVRDAKGSWVLEAVSEGPWFLAKLDPGKYRITATRERDALQQVAQISGKGLTQLVFRWPVPEVPLAAEPAK